MKMIKILYLILLTSLSTSCVGDDDFSVPSPDLEESEIDVNFSIAKVKEFYRGFEPVIVQAGPGANKPLYIEGYVVSNDEAGNFFRTLIIQDKAKNPGSAIAIATDATDVYTLFEPGRKIYVRVDGLYSGAYAGLPSLGIRDAAGSRDVGRISVSAFDERVIRSGIKEELVPKKIKADSIAEKYLNMLVQLEHVQFAEEELGASYASLTGTYGVNRDIQDCKGNSFILRTSGYADFKNMPLPEGNGTITGVLGRFNTDFQLLMRDTEDIDFSGARCN